MNEEQQRPHATQVRHFINAHKILPPVVVLVLMAYEHFRGVLAWVCLALCGICVIARGNLKTVASRQASFLYT